MYLVYLDKTNWQGNLVALKAYLLTQDLHKTQLWLWTDHPSHIVNDDTKAFFDTFTDVITVKLFDWDAEIEDTPWVDDVYFGNHFQVKSDFESFPPGYSDLVRHLLLYKHGGFWVDSDAVLLRDVYPVTIGVSVLAVTCISHHLCASEDLMRCPHMTYTL